MKNPTAFAILLTLNILYGLTLFLYPIMLYMSVFLFDAPSSYHYWGSYAIAFTIMSYPLWPILSLLCWVFYHRSSYTWAYIIANLALVWLLVLILMFIIV